MKHIHNSLFMGNLSLKETTYRKLLSICSMELVDCVFNDFKKHNGIILITKEGNDIWDITHYIFTSTIPLNENLKVLSTFDYFFGTRILYQGRVTDFSVLCALLRNKDATNVSDIKSIQLCWARNSLNNTQPSFDLGVVDIPQVFDKYTITKINEMCFRIEEWIDGGYKPMKNECFKTEEMAQERIQKLLLEN